MRGTKRWCEIEREGWRNQIGKGQNNRKTVNSCQEVQETDVSTVRTDRGSNTVEIKERNDRQRERERGTKRWCEIEREEWRDQIGRGQKNNIFVL